MKIQIEDQRGHQIGMTIPYNYDMEFEKGSVITTTNNKTFFIESIKIEHGYICVIVNDEEAVTDEKKLKNLGWTIVCESPFELQHENGDFASGFAATILKDELIKNYEDYIE